MLCALKVGCSRPLHGTHSQQLLPALLEALPGRAVLPSSRPLLHNNPQLPAAGVHLLLLRLLLRGHDGEGAVPASCCVCNSSKAHAAGLCLRRCSPSAWLQVLVALFYVETKGVPIEECPFLFKEHWFWKR